MIKLNLISNRKLYVCGKADIIRVFCARIYLARDLGKVSGGNDLMLAVDEPKKQGALNPVQNRKWIKNKDLNNQFEPSYF